MERVEERMEAPILSLIHICRVGDAMIANAGRFNLEHCNNITNSAGRRVWGFMGAVSYTHLDVYKRQIPTPAPKQHSAARISRELMAMEVD